jgi:hypothetical protein
MPSGDGNAKALNSRLPNAALESPCGGRGLPTDDSREAEMRPWLLAILLILMATDVLAAPIGKLEAQKRKQSAPAPIVTAAERDAALRQGGDTFASAFPFATIPYTDSGSTVGYTDDYEESCGTGEGAAPDVVYAFTPPTTGYYDFNLCGSAYDTKLNIYDQGETLLACNDDVDYTLDPGDPCCLNARIADYFCTAGETYYLVVDGYGTEAGDYTLTVSDWVHCAVETAGATSTEGEAPLVTGENDLHNCGCNCAGTPVNVSVMVEADGQAAVALVQGWRDFGVRDADWFEFTAGSSGSVHVEFESALRARIRVFDSVDCDLASTLVDLIVAPCDVLAFDVNMAPGAVFPIALMPQQYVPPFGGVPAEYDALLTVSGLSPSVATATTSWGALKAMYR